MKDIHTLGVREEISKCVYCGKDICTFNFDKKSPIYLMMRKVGCCYECAYWENLYDNPLEHMEVIEHTLYDFLPYREPRFGEMLGSTMYILRIDGTPVYSNDVWKKGKIPNYFLHKFPETAYPISKKTYKKLTTGRMGCVAIGCLDRYHCYRYNIQNELKTGPYNKVPRDWIVGDEKCPAFINLKEIKHYNYTNIYQTTI